MSGWLFKGLQQRVLPREIEGLRVVDNRYTPLAAHWSQSEPLDQVTYLFNQNFDPAGIARDIDEVRMYSGGNLDACCATIASRQGSRATCACRRERDACRAILRGATEPRPRCSFAQ